MKLHGGCSYNYSDISDVARLYEKWVMNIINLPYDVNRWEEIYCAFIPFNQIPQGSEIYSSDYEFRKETVSTKYTCPNTKWWAGLVSPMEISMHF